MAELISGMDGASYSVRRSLHDPNNIRKSKKAIRTAFEVQKHELGFAIVELLSSCPTNWGYSPAEALDWIKYHMLPVFPIGDYKTIDEVNNIKS